MQCRNFIDDISFALVAAFVPFVISIVIRSYMVDDAYIFLTYAENLVTRGQWTFNGLTLANGVTSPLYTILLAFLGFVTHLDIEKISVILNAIVWLLWGGITYFLLREFIKVPLLTLLASLIIITLPYFPTIYRMETHLTLVLLGCVILSYLHKHYMLMGILGGLAILSRPDSALLLCIIFSYLLVRDRKALSSAIISSIITILPWLSYSWFVFGTIFPDTLSAKVGQGASGFWPISFFSGMLNAVKSMYQQVPITIILFIVLIIPLMKSLRFFGYTGQKYNKITTTTKRSEIVGILLIYLIFYIIIYGVVLKVPNYHWYYAPVFYFGCILLLAQFSWFLRSFTFSGEKAIFGLLLLVISLGQQWVANMPLRLQPLSTGVADYKVIGEFLRTHTPKTATLGATEVGALSWYSKRSVIDSIGLDDPQLAAKVTNREVGWWLRHRAPDYILFNNPTWVWQKATPYQEWVTVPWFQKAYQPYHEFSLVRGRYILYRKIMSPDQAVRETSSKPPPVAFCLENISDQEILGVDSPWIIRIKNAKIESQFTVRQYYNVRPVSNSNRPNNYECLTADPIIELSKIVPSKYKLKSIWFLRVKLAARGKSAKLYDSLGQIFLATKVFPEYSENRVINFRVLLDGKMHTYYIPLYINGKWLGWDDLFSLRLDPISDLGEFNINSIELCTF